MKYSIYIILAAILWYVMFVIKPFNFWVSMAFSTLLLSSVSFFYYPKQFKKEFLNLKEIGIGLGSAALLYLIFWFGKFILDSFGIIPNHTQGISNVYANKGVFPDYIVGLLLFFPIGFGEEFFWRGYIQRTIAEKYGKWIAFLLTIFFYTLVHLPTLNFILILAAFLVGIYWGLIFLWRGNIVAATISHMVWDPLIFILFPLN